MKNKKQNDKPFKIASTIHQQGIYTPSVKRKQKEWRKKTLCKWYEHGKCFKSGKKCNLNTCVSYLE